MFNIYNVKPIVYKQALISGFTWFFTYFFIRMLLNPCNKYNDFNCVFYDSLFGGFAVFIMVITNFVLFKFYDAHGNEEKVNIYERYNNL